MSIEKLQGTFVNSPSRASSNAETNIGQARSSFGELTKIVLIHDSISSEAFEFAFGKERDGAYSFISS